MTQLSTVSHFCLALGLGVALTFGAPMIRPALAESVATAPVASVDAARIAALSSTMLMDEILAVMRDEGLDYGRTLEAEMFSGNGGADWEKVVGLIYDTKAMRQRLDAALAQALASAGDDLALIEEFYGSERGQKILRLEIEARRALLDSDVEDAAKLAWEDLRDADDPRAAKLTEFATVNDLIESNVMGAMNANLAFYRGLSESGAFPQEMTEDQMLADVWSQEPDVRAETEDWLYPFLSLAYQPLPDEDLEAYIAFSESSAGQKMNAALFAAFDVVFSKISYDLGRAAAKQMQGEDI